MNNERFKGYGLEKRSYVRKKLMARENRDTLMLENRKKGLG
jgi:hypothetical protein